MSKPIKKAKLWLDRSSKEASEHTIITSESGSEKNAECSNENQKTSTEVVSEETIITQKSGSEKVADCLNEIQKAACEEVSEETIIPQECGSDKKATCLNEIKKNPKYSIMYPLYSNKQHRRTYNPTFQNKNKSKVVTKNVNNANKEALEQTIIPQESASQNYVDCLNEVQKTTSEEASEQIIIPQESSSVKNLNCLKKIKKNPTYSIMNQHLSKRQRNNIPVFQNDENLKMLTENVNITSQLNPGFAIKDFETILPKSTFCDINNSLTSPINHQFNETKFKMSPQIDINIETERFALNDARFTLTQGGKIQCQKCFENFYAIERFKTHLPDCGDNHHQSSSYQNKKTENNSNYNCLGQLITSNSMTGNFDMKLPGFSLDSKLPYNVIPKLSSNFATKIPSNFAPKLHENVAETPPKNITGTFPGCIGAKPSDNNVDMLSGNLIEKLPRDSQEILSKVKELGKIHSLLLGNRANTIPLDNIVARRSRKRRTKK